MHGSQNCTCAIFILRTELAYFLVLHTHFPSIFMFPFQCLDRKLCGYLVSVCFKQMEDTILALFVS